MILEKDMIISDGAVRYLVCERIGAEGWRESYLACRLTPRGNAGSLAFGAGAVSHGMGSEKVAFGAGAASNDVGSERVEIREGISLDDFVPEKVVVTVYDLHAVPEGSLAALPDRESALCDALGADIFPGFRGSFTNDTDVDGKCLRVIVRDDVRCRPLRQMVQHGALPDEDKGLVFVDVLRSLSLVSNRADGACHFNVCDSTVYTYIDSDGRHRAFVTGMNFVTNDFDKSPTIDKSMLNNAFRAPETHVSGFTPLSMQFSLALLYAYIMQGAHPWSLAHNCTPYTAFKAMRRLRPVLDVPDDVRAVLARALSVDASKRYSSLDDFITALALAAGFDLGADFVRFSPEVTRPAHVAVAESEPEQDDADEPADGQLGKEPRLSVKMEPRKGDGFKAVAGMGQLKNQLKCDFIDIVQNKELAGKYGLTIPGVLMYGPPGTGKTYIAGRLAEELGLDVSIVSPADLGNIYVHGSQTMIKQLFEKAERKAARNKKGVLLVFDEMDAFVPQRTVEDHGNQSGEVAEFLTRLNNASSRGVYVIGTTNCLDRIDKAVIRKGRIDKVVYVGMPDADARGELFKYELGKRQAENGIDIERLASITDGFTASDITYIVTESARLAFAQALADSDPSVSIKESTIEAVIAKTRPSVSKSDLRRYEQMRDMYAEGGAPARPSVGFSTN